jgi:hypothetical protein
MLFLTSSITAFILSSLLVISIVDGKEVLYSDCDINEYYDILGLQDKSNWNKTSIGYLLRDTHRTVVPYTHSTKLDVWDALIDLDGSDGKVRLIYKNIDVPATPYGTTTTWNREHLWPKSRGIETTGPDMTDIHHLRPSDLVRIHIMFRCCCCCCCCC